MAATLLRAFGVAALVTALLSILAAIQWHSQFPLVFAAVSPTAYQLYSAPAARSSRVRNAVIGHATAIGAGVLALSVFGLLDAPSIDATHLISPPRIAAIALTLFLTLLVLESLRAHHAPAAATALLVASGTAVPGPTLAGLAIALAAVISVAPLADRVIPTTRESNPDPAAGTADGR